MFPFAVSILLVLVGILISLRYVTHVSRNKLPPGPIPLPIIGNLHLLGKYPHRALYKLAQKYGPIMSIVIGGKQAVVVSSPEALKLFLGSHDATFASRPHIQASDYLSYDSKAMVFTEYGPQWQRLRKLCTVELLSGVKVNSYLRMRLEEIGLMVEEIRGSARACEVVNLTETTHKLVANMTSGMLFGRKLDEKFKFWSLVEETAQAIGAFNLSDYIPMLI